MPYAKMSNRKMMALCRSRRCSFQKRRLSSRLTAVQCDQTTKWATPRIMCREEVEQSLQGRVRFLLRVRSQHDNSIDRSSGSFSPRWRGMGIFAVAQLGQLPDRHAYVLGDPICGNPERRSTSKIDFRILFRAPRTKSSLPRHIFQNLIPR
jgi:hypothetical protein